MIQPPVQARIAGVLAIHLVRQLLAALNSPNGEPVIVQVSCGGSSRQIKVGLEALRQLPLRDLQQFLLSYLADQLMNKNLGPMMGIRPDTFAHMKSRSERRRLLPHHVARLCGVVEIDPGLKELLEWLAKENARTLAAR